MPPLLGRGSMAALILWGFLVLAFAAIVAEITPYWWIIPTLGSIVPAFLVLLHYRNQREVLRARRGASRAAPAATNRSAGERELLDALRDRGELTSTTAALHTSLTVDEASEMLESLSGKGHLEARAEDGTLVYALRERDRRSLAGARGLRGEGANSAQASDALAPAAREASAKASSPTGRLPEGLSEREREVLRLLAGGRTNREIAGELYLALGTVKAHVNNVYRKLGAKNRAEAVSRARDLDLLG